MRRWLAIGGALVLAAVGSFLLINYVQGAEERALEGQTLVKVLVVVEPIEQGTTVSEIRDRVELRDLQAQFVVEDAVSDLGDLSGLITAVDLVPGEQVLLSRFETPSAAAVDTRIEVPAEFLQATISLLPEQAVGGRLVPGDLVAIVASFEPERLSGVEPGDPQSLEDALDSIIVVPGPEPTETGGAVSSPVSLETPNSTQIIIHKVLVTGVQLDELPAATTDGATAVGLSPTGHLLITIAATAADIEKIIFTAEFGSIWLALEDPEAPEPDTEIRTRRNVFE